MRRATTRFDIMSFLSAVFDRVHKTSLKQVAGEFEVQEFADRTLLPRPCPTLITFQPDEVWDGFFQGLPFVTLLSRDLFSRALKCADFLLR